MRCSIGSVTKDKCNNSSYTASSKLKNIKEYCAETQNLLFLRVQGDIETVCSHHEKKYLGKYRHLYGQSCCDPFAIHTKIVKKSLREITLELSVHYSTLKLVPGKSLCSKCYTKLSSNQDTNDEECQYESDDLYEPPDTSEESVNKVCAAVGVSPLKVRKLSVDKRSTAVKRKLNRITKSVKEKLCDSFEVDLKSDNEVSEKNDADEYTTLITKLKIKMQNISNVSDKVKILSLLPQKWSIRKVASEFNVSEYLVRHTRKLMDKYGIFPNPEDRKGGTGKTLSDGNLATVNQFYNSDEVSRVCPGMKDFVSIRNNEGLKEHHQKRLILCNLKELHVRFRECHPEILISFSKFAELRPKHCILAGPHGTHTVCVCTTHQNMKLMISGAKLQVSYKDLLEVLVCDTKNEKCMLQTCKMCPGSNYVREYLLSLSTDEAFDTQVTYRHWVATDRCDLVFITRGYSDYVEILSDKLVDLCKHHYISKIQSEYLKKRRENLAENECIILGDFSENFTFVVQDEIQSYHWVNAQATLHPFVLYFNEESKLTCRSFCVISDCLTHNVDALYTFQKEVISQLKSIAGHVSKVLYFSDGAAGQYKNRKNFMNLCHRVAFFCNFPRQRTLRWSGRYNKTTRCKSKSAENGGQSHQNSRKNVSFL